MCLCVYTYSLCEDGADSGQDVARAPMTPRGMPGISEQIIYPKPTNTFKIKADNTSAPLEEINLFLPDFVEKNTRLGET